MGARTLALISETDTVKRRRELVHHGVALMFSRWERQMYEALPAACGCTILVHASEAWLATDIGDLDAGWLQASY